MTSILQVQGITKRFGGLTAVDKVSLSVEAGGITGLIGPNGAGKTTLFSLISGFERPSLGHIFFRGEEVTELAPHRGRARHRAHLSDRAALREVERRREHRGRRLSAKRLARRGDAKAGDIAARLGLEPMLDKPAASLTVAGRKRLELARALATEPVLLLLDEVLAGLNPSEMRDIIPVIRAIRDNGVTVIMVEHVMHAVMTVRACHRAEPGPHDRRWLAARGHARSTGRRGLSRTRRGGAAGGGAWLTPRSSRLRASSPAMARPMSCAASISMSRRARRSRCWVRTASARRRSTRCCAAFFGRAPAAFASTAARSNEPRPPRSSSLASSMCRKAGASFRT